MLLLLFVGEKLRRMGGEKTVSGIVLTEQGPVSTISRICPYKPGSSQVLAPRCAQGGWWELQLLCTSAA